jgi:iron complex outermembrane receptor protein
MLAIAICSTSANAQSSSGDDQSSANSLGEIVVTAQRREQSLSKVPVSVQAVSDLELKTQVIEDTASLVKISPSVAFTGGFSANSSGFVIRGITSASSEGGLQQSTAMVVDGVPLARPGEFLGDLGDIQRVEILRGPQGTLFGKNATAGVVSIVTQRPTSKFEGYAEGSTTTDGEYLLRGMLNAPIGSKVSMRVNGYYNHLDPLIRNEGPGNDQYGYERYGFAGKLDFDFDAVTVKLSADYRHSYSTFGQSLDIVQSTGIGALQVAALGFTPQRGVVRLSTDGKSFDRSKGYAFTGEIGADLADGLKLTSVTGYRDFKDENQSDVDATPVGFVAGKGFSTFYTGYYPVLYVDIASADEPRQPQHVRYFSQEVRLNYDRGPLNAVAGAFFQTLKDSGAGITPFIFDGAFIRQDPTLLGTYLYNATQLDYRIKDDTYAVFGDVTYAVTDTVSLFGGLRYTHEKIDLDYQNATYFGPVATDFGQTILPGLNGQPAIDIATGRINLAPISTLDYSVSKSVDNLSGRAGIQFQPNTDTNFYFSFNRGYKGPAADVSRGSGAPDPVTGYSPLLRPEIATSFELGAKLKLFNDNLQLNVNLFKQKVKDIQQAIVLPSTVTQLINAGDIKTDGVEVEFRGRLADGLTVDGGFVYNDPRYSGDVIVGCYPGQTAATGCNVPVGARFFQNMDGAQTVNSYKWRYNAGATYLVPLDTHGMDLTFRVGYQWYASSPQRLDTDPMMREPSHGLLDASITLAGQNGKWSIQAFGKNLTNDFYYAGLVNVDNTISRVSGWVNRDYRRYGGLKLRVGF